MDKTTSSSRATLSKILRPLTKKAEKPKSKISAELQTDMLHKAHDPNIVRAYVNAIESSFFKRLFGAEELPGKAATTYAKAHYFPTGKEFEEKESDFLLRERFQEKKQSVPLPKLLFGVKYKLNSVGTLQVTASGFVYLKVDEAFVDVAYPFFYKKGADKPPFIAHIPVMSEDEISNIGIGSLKEIGQPFKFRIKDCVEIEPSFWREMEKIWAFTVESTELEHLRESYCLTSKLHSQDFIIVVAIKRKTEIGAIPEKEKHFLRINPASTRA